MKNFEHAKKIYDVTDWDIITLLGCSEKTLWNKKNGVTGFSYGETKLIRDSLFPGMSIEYLFETEESESPQKSA